MHGADAFATTDSRATNLTPYNLKMNKKYYGQFKNTTWRILRLERLGSDILRRRLEKKCDSARIEHFAASAFAASALAAKSNANSSTGRLKICVVVNSSFDGWAFGQPDNNYNQGRSPYQACNSLHISRPSSAGWSDENCADKSFSHICHYGRWFLITGFTVFFTIYR